MTLLFGLALLAVLGIPLAIAISRATELFVLEVRTGSIRLVRGRAPSRMLDDLRDVIPAHAAARIRVVVEQGRARVIVRGDLDEGTRQRVRNVVGTWPVAKIRAGRRGG